MHLPIHLVLAVAVGLAAGAAAADSPTPKPRRGTAVAEPGTAQPVVPPAFAPLPDAHPLAALWNDPDFARRLVGSYGFLSEAEPRMSPEEQVLYREKIVPLLRTDPKQALPELRAAIKPGASAVFDFTLGTVYFQSEDLTNAVAHYEQALAKFPDYRRAQRNLALALVRSGRYEDAVRPLTRTIALGGADGRIFGLLGFAHLSANRFVSAQGAYEQASVFEPDNLDYRLGLVKAQMGLSQYDAAIALLDELIQQHPGKDSLWALQAQVYVQREQPAKAIVNLEVLRRLDLITPPQLVLLGDLHLTQENRDLALEAYSAAVARDGGKAPERGLRPAELLISRGAFAQARELLKGIRAAGVPTGEGELKLLKLEARVAMSTGEAEQGARTLETILERNPLDGEALLLAGDHYARVGQREKAEFRYDAAAKLEAFAADALLKHAQLKVQMQKYTEAVELLRRAQKVKPRDNVARYLERVEQVAARVRS